MAYSPISPVSIGCYRHSYVLTTDYSYNGVWLCDADGLEV